MSSICATVAQVDRFTSLLLSRFENTNDSSDMFGRKWGQGISAAVFSQVSNLRRISAQTSNCKHLPERAYATSIMVDDYKPEALSAPIVIYSTLVQIIIPLADVLPSSMAPG